MMNINTDQTSHCAYAEQLVSFLYDEIEPRERKSFEEHLSSCQDCPAEIAAFQELRFTFNDWRELRHEQTPSFVVSSDTDLKENKPSWLDRLRHTWLSPARSFAAASIVILIFAGIYFLTLNRNSSSEISQDIHPKLIGHETEEIVEQPLTAQSPANFGSISEPSVTVGQSSRIDRLPDEKSVTRNAITANKTKGKIKTEIRPSANELAKNDRSSNRKKVPRVITTEEEDNSLRLADIFDEVSMR